MAGTATRSASASLLKSCSTTRSKPERVRTGPGVSVHRAKSKLGSVGSSGRSTPNTSQSTPSSKAKTPSRTGTATLRTGRLGTIRSMAGTGG